MAFPECFVVCHSHTLCGVGVVTTVAEAGTNLRDRTLHRHVVVPCALRTPTPNFSHLDHVVVVGLHANIFRLPGNPSISVKIDDLNRIVVECYLVHDVAVDIQQLEDIVLHVCHCWADGVVQDDPRHTGFHVQLIHPRLVDSVPCLAVVGDLCFVVLVHTTPSDGVS